MKIALFITLICFSILFNVRSQVVSGGVNTGTTDKGSYFNLNYANDYPNYNADAICTKVRVTTDRTKCYNPYNTCAICLYCRTGRAVWLSDTEVDRKYKSSTSYEKRVWSMFCFSEIRAFGILALVTSLLTILF